MKVGVNGGVSVAVGGAGVSVTVAGNSPSRPLDTTAASPRIATAIMLNTHTMARTLASQDMLADALGLAGPGEVTMATASSGSSEWWQRTV